MDPLYTIGIPLLALIVGLLVGAWFGRRGTAELEWKVQSLQKSLDRQGSDLAAMTAQKEELEPRARSLQVTNAKLQERAQLSEDNLATLRGQAQQLQSQFKAVQANRATLAAELDQCAAERRELASQQQELISQLEAASASRQELEADLEAAEEERQRLAAEVAPLRESIASLRNELKFATVTAAAQPMALPARSGRSSTMTARTPRGDVSVISAEEALAERDQALADAFQEIKALRYSLSTLTSLSAELATTLEERNRAYENVLNRAAGIPEIPAPKPPAPVAERAAAGFVAVEPEAAAGDQDDRIALQAALDDLQAQLDAAQVELDVVTAARDDLAAQVEGHDAELQAVTDKLAALQAELDTTRAAKAQVEDDLNQQSLEMEQMAGHLEALQGDLQPYLGPEQAQGAAGMQAPEAAQTARVGLVAAGVTGALATIKDKDDQLAALQAHAGELASQVAGLNEQVTGQQAELEASQATRAQLEEELGHSSAALDDLTGRLKALRDQLAPVLGQETSAAVEGEVEGEAEGDGGETAEAAGEEAPVDAVAAGVSKALATLEQQDADLTSLRAQAADLSGQVSYLSDLVAGFQAELDTTRTVKAQVEAQLGDTSARLDELDGRAGELQAQLQSYLPAAGDEAAGQPDPEAAGIGLVAAGVSGALAAIQRKDEEISALQAQVDDLSGQTATLNEQIANLEAAKTDLEAQVATLTSAKEGLEADAQTKEQALADVQAQNATLQATVDDLNGQVADLQRQIETLNGQIANLQTELEATKSDKAQLQSQLQDANDQLDQVNRQLDAVEAELQPFMAAAQPAEAGQRSGKLLKVGAVSAGALGAVGAVRQREKEVAEANEKIADLEQQLSAISADKAAMEADLQARQENLAGVQEQIESLTAQVASLQGDLEAAQAEKAAMEDNLQGRDEELAAIRAQLETLSTEVATTAESRDAVQALLEAREANMADLQAKHDEVTTLFRAAPAVEDMARWFTSLPGPKNGAANAAIGEGVLPHRFWRPQKLSDVKGVGVVFEQRLYDAGVGTYWELANLTDQEFSSILNITDWQMLRLDLPGIRADAARLAQETESVGAIWEQAEVDDFEVIQGLGHTYERRLYAAGVQTYEALARMSVEELAEICRAPKMRTPNYANWIEQAQSLSG